MPNILSTTETSLNSFFTTLYPDLSDESPPSTHPTLETFEHIHTTSISDPEVNTARNNFLINWKASVEIESGYLTETSKPRQTSAVRKLITQLEEKRIKAHKETNDTLSLYTYILIKDKLQTSVTPETIRENTHFLRNYIQSLNGDEKNVDTLVQQLHIVHGKQREFNTRLVTVLQKEALLQHTGLRKCNAEFKKEREKIEKKWKAAEERLKENRDELNKLDQVRKDNANNLKLLDDSQTHAEILKNTSKTLQNIMLTAKN